MVEDLQQQYTDLQTDLIDYEKNFIKTNVDSYISALILERFLNQKTLRGMRQKRFLTLTVIAFAVASLESMSQILSMHRLIQLPLEKLLLYLTGLHLLGIVLL